MTSRQILANQRRVSVSRPNVQSFEQFGRPSTTATRVFAVSVMEAAVDALPNIGKLSCVYFFVLFEYPVAKVLIEDWLKL